MSAHVRPDCGLGDTHAQGLLLVTVCFMSSSDYGREQHGLGKYQCAQRQFGCKTCHGLRSFAPSVAKTLLAFCALKPARSIIAQPT